MAAQFNPDGYYVTLTLASVTPAVVEDNGGYLIRISGQFKGETAQVSIVGTGVDALCYSAQEGCGYAPVPDSPTILTVATPPLPVAGPFDLRVVQGAETVTLLAAVTVVARNFHKEAMKIRKMMPRWYATGARDLGTLPLILEEAQYNP